MQTQKEFQFREYGFGRLTLLQLMALIAVSGLTLAWVLRHFFAH